MGEQFAVVTGGTSGLGKATAIQLAREGYRVLALGRDERRGQATVEAARPARVSFVRCDFASLASVQATGERLRRELPALRVLVNNAGAVFQEHGLTEDGYERTFAVNHLAPFLLTRLLLEPLRRGVPARIINITSAVERLARLEVEDLHGDTRRHWLHLAYARSKQANLLFTYELAARLARSGISVNALHPGLLDTGIGTDTRGLFAAIFRGWKRLATTAEEGAQMAVHLATAPELAGVTGRYFDRGREARSSRRTYRVALQQALWAESERLIARAIGAPDIAPLEAFLTPPPPPPPPEPPPRP